jgi:hypothetical protein
MMSEESVPHATLSRALALAKIMTATTIAPMTTLGLDIGTSRCGTIFCI